MIGLKENCARILDQTPQPLPHNPFTRNYSDTPWILSSKKPKPKPTRIRVKDKNAALKISVPISFMISYVLLLQGIMTRVREYSNPMEILSKSIPAKGLGYWSVYELCQTCQQTIRTCL
ncbi:hypothetical protein LYNGBM3L_12290 [Moorena producens 3L]|uniref:Uncharacterized protein n=1 Tax=Moorena producens 3L TaxID=489825 RepID=F4XKT7_9CYAN|nr:hypothetical protein LYNGBM3L_12290 [Moorena producens 3L]OLT68444.1 hypothetical protein BI334_28600 [Moorena producens 3L]